MKTLADKTLKPVLIIGGAGTALAGVDAFLPRYAVENVQKLEFIPEYTIFVQHWGIMVSLMGVFMIGAAFKQSWRTPILTYSLIEKAFMVFLVFSNFGALNCIADLRPMFGYALDRLEPGGYLAVTLMGRFCAWETVGFALRAV